MAIISLRAYNREIEGMIDNGQLDEAVAHCRHILTTFPKHIATYRLLGKAHLEQQRISDATDIFQRVLSAIPDDFVSNVGMSIIREDENNLDASIWHMELAYESQPANVAIQDELRRLYGRRDGMQPPRVRLTRGALARMYSKGGLYDQAIAELRAAITEDPNRPDLQLLLAQMFFQTSQRVEAVDTCVNILKKMPLCLEANRILAVSLPDAEGSDAVKNARQIVVSMDPYYAFAEKEAISSDQVSENAVNVEQLEWKSGIQVGEAPEQPSWATSLGISLDKQADENIPEWLKAAEAPATASPTDKASPSVSPFIWDTQEVEKIITDTSKPEGELPDWMKDAGWKPSTSEASQVPPETTNPEGTSEPIATGEGAVEADIPDWLRGIAPSGFITNEPQAAPVEEDKISNPWLEPHQPGPTDSIIHWLDEEKKPNTAPASTEKGENLAYSPDDEVPDWLKDIDLPQPTSVGEDKASLAAAAAFTAGISAFMEGSEQPKPVSAEVVVPDEAQSDLGVVPEEILTQPMPVPTEIEPPAQPTSEEELPDWLKAIAPAAAVETLPEVTPDEGATLPEALPPLEIPLEELPAEEAQPAPADKQPESHIPAAVGALVAAEMLTKPEEKESVEAPAEPPSTVETPGELPPLVVAAALAGESAISQPEQEAGLTPPGVVPAADQELPFEVEPTPDELVPTAEPEAFAWLKGLTDEQDAAKTEELIIPGPEGEVQPPDWVKLELEPVTDVLAHPAPLAEPAEEVPEWIKGLGEEPEAPQAAEVPEEITQPEAEQIAEGELPAWLIELEQPEAEKEAASTAEEPLEWEPEELPDWLKEITESEQASQPAEIETTTVEKLAAAAVVASLTGEQETPPAPTPSEPESEAPLPEVVSSAEVEATLPSALEPVVEPAPEPAPMAPEAAAEAPLIQVESSEELVPTAEVPADSTLADARKALEQGQPSQAAAYYAGLIKQNYRLDEVIKDLQQALYRFPVDIDMWVTLGDAHCRTNDLQEALDAYNKAEELVR